MKKIFLLLIAVLTAWNVSAQELERQSLVKYQGEVDLGYSFNTETEDMHRINLHTIHGVRVGEYVFAGIGTGLDYYHNTVIGGELAVPLFLNMKGYLPKFEDIQPYLSMDIGMGIGLTEDVQDFSGGMYGIALGVQGNLVKVQIGYNVQTITEDGAGLHFEAIQIKLGIKF